MKLYQYDEFKKLNQALSSFKRNKVPIIKVEILTVGDKFTYFILTDPVYEPKEKTEKVKLKEEKKVENKKESKKKEITS